jgi:hypothetical protein
VRLWDLPEEDSDRAAVRSFLMVSVLRGTVLSFRLSVARDFEASRSTVGLGAAEVRSCDRETRAASLAPSDPFRRAGEATELRRSEEPLSPRLPETLWLG